MADIRPFAAYRPAPGKESKIAALPYDVFTREEAREEVQRHPDSFLAIDRPETQFPPEQDMYAPAVYRKAAQMLQERIRKGDFVQDPTPCYYLYEQTFRGRTQTGIVGCASIDDYLHGIIRKHENTREDKEQDRIHHVDACNAQTGPIFLAYRNHPEIDELTDRIRSNTPVCDFESAMEVRNRVFVISDPADIEKIHTAFSEIKRIYIADGHHRCASAVKVGLKRREQNPGYTGDEEFNYFLAVLFPQNELQILDYNRIVRDLNGHTKEEIIAGIKQNFIITPKGRSAVHPSQKGEIAMYLCKRWYLLTAQNRIRAGGSVAGLDVSLLQNYIMAPIFGIQDPRTDPRIRFLGGIHGYGELTRLADETGGTAFGMYPTSMEELFRVADDKKLMPPKSTWFEPKLLSGLFIHMLE